MSALTSINRRQKSAANNAGKFLLVNTTLMTLFSALSPALKMPAAIAASSTAGAAAGAKGAKESSAAGTMLAMSSAGKQMGYVR